MESNVAKKNKVEPENDDFPELHIDDPEELPQIIINTVLPNDLLNQNALAGNTPLFIKKLWKMVNDDNTEEIIGWNVNGDGFIIHDQLQFVSKTLPKYFKHNHLSSFVRQLNLYDFHKMQNVEKEEFQFTHPFFLREVPQLLPLIKRKPSSGRQKSGTTKTSEPTTGVQEVMNAVKDVKTKSDVIANELTKLRQENAALWGEMNSLRVKYSKQTKIINKLIHFLISYMQKHHNARKSGRTVNTTNANKYIKGGPKIMELDYRYKNNPHEFWTEYDNQQKNGEQQSYIVVEPADINMEIDTQAQNVDNTPNVTVSSAIEELLPGTSAFNQASNPSLDQTLPQINYAKSQPSSSKKSNSALQRAGGSKENLGYFIDNTQVEIKTIKELLKNLTPDEMTDFYKLVNENYKNQEEDMSPLELSPAEPESVENELIQLAQMSPINNDVQGQDLSFETNGNVQNLEMPFETTENVQVIDENLPELTTSLETSQTVPDLTTSLETSQTIPDLTCLETNENLDDQNTFSISQDELLSQNDLLNYVSVDQYFN